jgi:hypothetical protein
MNGALAPIPSSDIATTWTSVTSGGRPAGRMVSPDLAGPASDRLPEAPASPRGGRPPRTPSHIPVRIVGGPRRPSAR